jgi:hypothetical protein
MRTEEDDAPLKPACAEDPIKLCTTPGTHGKMLSVTVSGEPSLRHRSALDVLQKTKLFGRSEGISVKKWSWGRVDSVMRENGEYTRSRARFEISVEGCNYSFVVTAEESADCSWAITEVQTLIDSKKHSYLSYEQVKTFLLLEPKVAEGYGWQHHSSKFTEFPLKGHCIDRGLWREDSFGLFKAQHNPNSLPAIPEGWSAHLHIAGYASRTFILFREGVHPTQWEQERGGELYFVRYKNLPERFPHVEDSFGSGDLDFATVAKILNPSRSIEASLVRAEWLCSGVSVFATDSSDSSSDPESANKTYLMAGLPCDNKQVEAVELVAAHTPGKPVHLKQVWAYVRLEGAGLPTRMTVDPKLQEAFMQVLRPETVLPEDLSELFPCLEKTTMSDTTTGSSKLFETLKRDGTEASYRVAVRQVIKLLADPLSQLIGAAFHGEGAQKIAEALKTPQGRLVVAGFVSTALHGIQATRSEESEILDRLVRESRLYILENGMEEIAELLTSPLRDVVSKVVEGNPPAQLNLLPEGIQGSAVQEAATSSSKA